MVPIALLQDQLPKNLTAHQLSPGVGALVFTGLRCAKTAINSVDEGGATLFVLRTPIESIPGQKLAADVFPDFVWELRSSGAALRNELARAGISVRAGDVGTSATKLPTAYEMVSCAVTESAVSLYDVSFESSVGLKDSHLKARWAFLVDGGLASFQIDATMRVSGSAGGGAISLAEGSEARRVLSGAAAVEVLGSRVDVANLQLDWTS